MVTTIMSVSLHKLSKFLHGLQRSLVDVVEGQLMDVNQMVDMGQLAALDCHHVSLSLDEDCDFA